MVNGMSNCVPSGLKRQRRHRPGVRDDGKRADAVDQRRVELLLGGAGGVARGGQHDLDRHDARRPEAGAHRREVDEAADEEPRADEQHQRERDLGDDHDVRQPARAAARRHAASALLQDIGEVGPHRPPRGDEAEDEAGRDRDRRGERQDRQVEADLIARAAPSAV